MNNKYLHCFLYQIILYTIQSSLIKNNAKFPISPALLLGSPLYRSQSTLSSSNKTLVQIFIADFHHTAFAVCFTCTQEKSVNPSQRSLSSSRDVNTRGTRGTWRKPIQSSSGVRRFCSKAAAPEVWSLGSCRLWTLYAWSRSNLTV